MRKQTTTTLFTGALLLAAASPLSAENDWSIDWYTMDSGGVILSESEDGDWKLSGTIGQWEATEARASSGGDWSLTGGFWGLTLEELADLLFQDRFEED
jgi:hypothetical protein